MVPQDRLVQLRSPLSQTRALSATHMEELHHPRCSHAVLEHEQRTAKLMFASFISTPISREKPQNIRARSNLGDYIGKSLSLGLFILSILISLHWKKFWKCKEIIILINHWYSGIFVTYICLSVNGGCHSNVNRFLLTLYAHWYLFMILHFKKFCQFSFFCGEREAETESSISRFTLQTTAKPGMGQAESRRQNSHHHVPCRWQGPSA